MLTIYKASAGSGKTYTLAKNYITYLLGFKENEADNYRLNLAPSSKGKPRKLIRQNRHRCILAITFTRKATEEMKTRIIRELHKLSEMRGPGFKDPSPYAKDLCAEMKCDREELATTANLALQQLLYDYQNFHVSTIDSFFQRVLHTFARELDRQGDYNVELDDKNAMKAAVALMLDDFNYSPRPNKKLGDWLLAYMKEKVDSGTQANLFNRRSKLHNDLIELLSKISLESFKPFSKDMEKYLKQDLLGAYEKKFIAYRNSLLTKAKKIAEEVFGADGDSGLEQKRADIDKLGVANARKMILDVLDGKRLEMSIFSSSNFMKDMVNPSSEHSPFVSTVSKKNAGTPLTPREQQIKDLFVRIHSLYIQFYGMAPIKNAIAQLGMLQHAWRYLISLTEQNNLLLISDTNDLLKRVIGDDQTPFVYERMGVDLKHFLIDEFQDTSRMQWENLLPLVSNSMDMTSDNDCLVIGDVKQSIYRFRNSDSEILHSEVEHAFSKDKTYTLGIDRAENTNYRSSADVVRFNNTLFSLIAERHNIKGFENTVVQDIAPDNANLNGHISFNAVLADNATEYYDITLPKMADEIDRLVHEGKYSYGDIVVLVKTNSEAKAVVNFLINDCERDIPVLSDEALLLSSSWAVQLVISVLKIIDQEQSAEAAVAKEKVAQTQEGEKKPHYPSPAEVLLVLSRFQYFSHDPSLSHSQALSLALNPTEGDMDTRSLSQGIASIRQQAPSTLLALIETVIAMEFPDQAARGSHSAYLTALQDAAVEFANLNNGSLHAFLDWWDDKGQKIAISGADTANAVRVMTIHKSKGLEFDCVIVPMCNWPLTWSSQRLPRVWTSSHKNLAGLNGAETPPALYVTLNKECAAPGSLFYDDYKKEYDSSLIDCINTTYVAFTRAKRELIVWYKYGKDRISEYILEAIDCGAPKTSGGVEDLLLDFQSYATPISLPAPRSKKKEEDVRDKVYNLEIGQPTQKISKTDDNNLPDNPFAPLNILYPVVHRKELSQLTQLDSILELDKDVDDKTPTQPKSLADTPDAIARRNEGLAMHDIMERIEVAADAPKAIDIVCRRLRLTDATRREYSQRVDAMLADPRAARWFGDFAKTYREQPVYHPSTDEIRRPDRVVVYPDNSVDIIDYKFSDEEHRVGDGEHIKQVRLYMSLFQEMGYERVRGFLWYPFINEILEVHFS